jgi:hypothetical protein
MMKPNFEGAIVSLNDEGMWQLNLPLSLEEHQGELEQLLQKVFVQDITQSTSVQSRNLALAQQMSLNWCNFKYRQILKDADCDIS